MIFRTTKLAGALVIESEQFADERGFFSRSFSEQEFAAHGATSRLVETSAAFTARRHTIRGMHFQSAPHAQAKLVRCTHGAIYDVALDLRPGSPTYKQWIAETLTAENRLMLYVPEGCAHGYQTLEDDTEVLYHLSGYYAPAASGGVRWNDPVFAIDWPEAANAIMNDRDRGYPDYRG